MRYFCGVLANGDAGGGRVADDLVVHVGDVHDVLQLVAALPQEAAQQFDDDEGAEVADVAVVVNRGPAGVHADGVVFQRVELLDFGGQSIEELKRHKFAGSGEASIVARERLSAVSSSRCPGVNECDGDLSTVTGFHFGGG